jgi:hypothetical protein
LPFDRRLELRTKSPVTCQASVVSDMWEMVRSVASSKKVFAAHVHASEVGFTKKNPSDKN